MENNAYGMSEVLTRSVQINDGLTQTSGDGAALAFDKKYGIMFCAYMPGMQGRYGESRSKVCLSVFPASQPTNIRFVDVAWGHDEYCDNIAGLGDGKVRVFYEKNSRAEGDHTYCFKDYDFLTDTLGPEQTVMVKQEDGTLVPYCLSVQFQYLERMGYHQHKYVSTEQIGCCAYFDGDDGYTYGAAVSFLAEVILYRSADHGATVEFFAVYPKPAQYEFEYRFLNGRLYAIYRTDKDEDCIHFTTSDDMGKTWAEPVAFPGSIQCRPRMILCNEEVLVSYNHFCADTKNRPAIQQGRTSIKIRQMTGGERELCHLYSKCGMVNVCLADILGDLYLAYSTSELAMEYQNGNPLVRGKDAIRYVKLGDLKGEYR